MSDSLHLIFDTETVVSRYRGDAPTFDPNEPHSETCMGFIGVFACPKCGEREATDRQWAWQDGQGYHKYACRKCGVFGVPKETEDR